MPRGLPTLVAAQPKLGVVELNGLAMWYLKYVLDRLTVRLLLWRLRHARRNEAGAV
jgi:hypothetical protein